MAEQPEALKSKRHISVPKKNVLFFFVVLLVALSGLLGYGFWSTRRPIRWAAGTHRGMSMATKQGRSSRI